MHSYTVTFTFFFLLLSTTPLGTLSSSQPNSETSKTNNCFNPYNAFASNIHHTLSEIKKLVDIVSNFNRLLHRDRRLSSAISDCIELFDISSDQLTASASTANIPGGTGDCRADMLSYLSASLGNQDTCRESVAATDGLLGELMAAGLDAVSSSLSRVLRDVSSVSANANAKPKGARRLMMDKYYSPRWVLGAAERKRMLLSAGAEELAVDVVVAKDGSGDCRTVGEAVEKAPEKRVERFIIHVKGGVYNETVEIKKNKWNVMIIGDGMDKTVITGSKNFVDGWTTFKSATVAVSGKGFVARDLTIENTAGPSKHQAVALRSNSDLSIYYRCAFRGYQDTLYAHSLRQFYYECVISGTIDFIFGDASAVFQNCQITLRLPMPNQQNIVTAQGRKDPNENTGFSIQNCNVTADSDLVGRENRTYSYLGRPWKEYSRTMIMQSYLGEAIRPEGWMPWQGDFALSTLYYVEYMNTGPASEVAKRVKWQGYHGNCDAVEAAKFTVAQLIDGNLWLPSSGLKYTAGLN